MEDVDEIKEQDFGLVYKKDREKALTFSQS